MAELNFFFFLYGLNRKVSPLHTISTTRLTKQTNKKEKGKRKEKTKEIAMATETKLIESSDVGAKEREKIQLVTTHRNERHSLRLKITKEL